MTRVEAFSLRRGRWIYDSQTFYVNGAPRCWRVNGKIRKMRGRPEFFELPIKFGIREYGYVNDENLTRFHLTSIGAWEQYFLDRGHDQDVAARYATAAEVYHSANYSVVEFADKVVGQADSLEQLVQLVGEFYDLPHSQIEQAIKKYAINVSFPR